MEADIREFLRQFDTEDLLLKGVLRTADLFLQDESVVPLIILIDER